MAILIKDLPEDERPREKIVEKGAAYLSDAEILAVFFGTGRKGMSAVDLGREMIQRFGSLRNMSRATVEELTEQEGIGPAKAAQLAAVFEFGRRLAREPFHEQAITSPEDVYDLLGPEMQSLDQESVRVILLNHRKKLIHLAEIFRGTVNESFANPSEILRKALGHAASAIILVHNHPSGDPSPSQADHQVTKRMTLACDAVGIEFTDHIIIGCRSSSEIEPYFSFREAGLV
ncbi:MAG: DNA repair protein RadC [Verrucomicrobiales bacterium]|nr:DNA repair protein RadC [Verrucomicrobiales bacterium]